MNLWDLTWWFKQNVAKLFTFLEIKILVEHIIYNLEKLIDSSENWCTHLFSPQHLAVGDDEYLVLAVYLYHLRGTVGVARVVDVPCKTATQSGINHTVFVQSKHVHATILKKEKIYILKFMYIIRDNQCRAEIGKAKIMKYAT